MASTIGETDEAFPEVNVTRQLNLGVPEEFPVDPVSSKVAISKAHKEQAEAEAEAEAAKAKENCSCALTSTLVVSGVVVIAIGVAFIVAKKYRAL
ncbi:Cytochrome C oxidase subunit II transmembrane domain-containing protein [Dioscorea alata]|uniref:Cytochrome C oxidase subunit II transmembrane domain-containing protein n=1 Tax=Dioscorea alata TaxID=55571 RepID=A0ACB7VCR9_DIOAL|nr:Cytochrome C oxidase subunit II transmembrane domain-containing protein [Dioscorea alata]